MDSMAGAFAYLLVRVAVFKNCIQYGGYSQMLVHFNEWPPTGVEMSRLSILNILIVSTVS